MAVPDLKWRVTEIATCPICLEEVVDAKSLPCVHSFCLKCLQGHCKDKYPGQSASCPVCRKEFAIPVDGIPGLPHNFVLQNLLDAKKSAYERKGLILCDVCMKENVDKTESVPAATMYCVDCCQRLCKTCSHPHKMLSGGSHHLRDLVTGTGGKSELVKRRTSQCEKHKQKLIELYCFDCKMSLCMKCLAVGHNQHKCGEIEQVAVECSKHIDADIKKIRQQMFEFHMAMAKADAQSDGFRAAAEKVEKEIVEIGEKLKQVIDRHVDELQQAVRKLQAITMKDVDMQKDSLSLALVAMESYTEYAMEVKDKSSHSDVIMAADKLHSQAIELLQTYIRPDDICVPTVAFTPSNTVDKLMNTGQNIVGSMGSKLLQDLDSNKFQPLDDQTERKLNDEIERLKLIEKQFLALTAYCNSECQLMHTITCDEEVRGLTSLHKKLDVLRNADRDQVDVYDMNANYGQMRRHLSVPGSDVWDITSSHIRNCFYVSEFVDRAVYRINMSGRVSELELNGFEPRGLSVLPDGNLLVTCRNPNVLLELGDDGCINNQIYLDDDIAHPWHAVMLSTGDFAVCHGSGPKSLHRVCIVDACGNIVRSYGFDCGSDRCRLNVPCHLAVDEDDFIFVADCLNERVTLLTPELDFVYHVRNKMESRPQRLYLDRKKNRLYIGQRNGDVLVIRL